MIRTKFIFALLALAKFVITEDEQIVFKMCVPQEYYDDCLKFVEKPKSDHSIMECIAGRDRIDCLDLIQQKKAHVMIMEPEGVYIASQWYNENFRVIAELRYRDYINVNVEDEDQVLIKKTSTVNSLEDLRGLKSCHPYFDSYFGYKIPVTKLKKHGLLNVSTDPTILAVEQELKALSEFFEQSCISGPYSDDADVDRELKKKYPNLCQLCDNPKDCNDNNEYSHYKRAISCLVDGNGDIAFANRIEVSRFFGLIENITEHSANIDNYEYLCEDGTRKPINGTGCSWAKRPYSSYITNADFAADKELVKNLKTHLIKFINNAIEYGKSESREHFLIEEGMLLYNLDNIKPNEYVAEYKDLVERHEIYSYKARLCVKTKIELEKCKVLAAIAFCGFRPEIECYLTEENNCAADVANNKADIVIVPGYNWARVEKEFSNLKRVLHENIAFNELHIAIFDSSLLMTNVQKLPIKFDKNSTRAWSAACLTRLILDNNSTCDSLDGDTQDGQYIEIIQAKDRNNYKNKTLLCLDKTSSSIDDYFNCNMELYLQNAIYVNGNKSQSEIYSFTNLFTILGTKFGHAGLHRTVFDLFSQFKRHDDVLFNDYSTDFSGTENFNSFPEEHYNLIVKSQVN